jgi:hypothetical protein
LISTTSTCYCTSTAKLFKTAGDKAFLILDLIANFTPDLAASFAARPAAPPAPKVNAAATAEAKLVGSETPARR